jgi:NAD(P)-dependent dehydrogenase (short-subunit alcohol dehydrogenase family)
MVGYVVTYSTESLRAWTYSGNAGIYNSARSATTALSETLRIEMAPLGVRVVTVILGAVETIGNDPSNKGELELPADSYYQKIRDTINRYYKYLVYTEKDKQNVDVAARNTVNDVLGGNVVLIRRGKSSTTSWLLTTFLPSGFLSSIINKGSGLAELSGK